MEDWVQLFIKTTYFFGTELFTLVIGGHGFKCLGENTVHKSLIKFVHYQKRNGWLSPTPQPLCSFDSSSEVAVLLTAATAQHLLVLQTLFNDLWLVDILCIQKMYYEDKRNHQYTLAFI